MLVHHHSLPLNQVPYITIGYSSANSIIVRSRHKCSNCGCSGTDTGELGLHRAAPAFASRRRRQPPPPAAVTAGASSLTKAVAVAPALFPKSNGLAAMPLPIFEARRQLAAPDTPQRSRCWMQASASCLHQSPSCSAESESELQGADPRRHGRGDQATGRALSQRTRHCCSAEQTQLSGCCTKCFSSLHHFIIGVAQPRDLQLATNTCYRAFGGGARIGGPWSSPLAVPAPAIAAMPLPAQLQYDVLGQTTPPPMG
eukprot:359793-Chlamydomonas_euryale.AAC.18